jgi:hypothetical protein
MRLQDPRIGNLKLSFSFTAKPSRHPLLTTFLKNSFKVLSLSLSEVGSSAVGEQVSCAKSLLLL